MIVVYAQQPFPTEVTRSIMLCGPTPRDKANVASWRPEALQLLASLGYDGHVFVPELEEETTWSSDMYLPQVAWENEALNRADCILFWIPRDMAPDSFGYPKMGALTTNDEWGTWKSSGKAVLGIPPNAKHTGYQKWHGEEWHVPQAETLADTVLLALTKVGNGARRLNGECEVPLLIWNYRPFQDWYAAQLAVGNRLDGARVHWNFRVGKDKSIPFLVALHVNVFIASENRNKVNEFVVMRPDVSSVLLWKRGASLLESEVVLVREFRSPVRNSVGFVYELPGGSSKANIQDTIKVAIEEVHEETGFELEASRLRQHTSRQLASTLITHCSTLFSYEMTTEEMNRVRADEGNVHGIEEDSERTFSHVMRVGDIVGGKLVDWTTLGQIFQVISGTVGS